MTALRASMRLQFHNGFTFDDAVRLAPYLSALGISHVYASPIMTARRGSLHGYDVIDPTRVNPELGGEDALIRLVEALRAKDMGFIVDMVPNHMAAVTDNPWWADVLGRGRHSRYAHFFDIDWEPEDPSLRGKVLLPILGRPYGEALAGCEIRLARNARGAGFCIGYFDHVLPIASQDCRELERTETFDPATSGGREQLHCLLERQHYRLAWWRTANDEINWRRFFEINDLVALRMEDEDAFEAVHGTLFRLYAEGLVDGIRVDHIDGLSYPQKYCQKLRTRLHDLQPTRPHHASAGPAYFVVEKILGPNEHLATSWQTDGTTGYDFMGQVSALLHDPAGEKPLADLWHRIGGRHRTFAAEERQSRREVLDRSFFAQFESMARAFHALARENLATRDWSKAAISRVLRQILIHFPVYRVYASVGSCSQSDRDFLGRAIARARIDCSSSDLPLLDRLGEWLSGENIPSQSGGTGAIAIARFQQLSAPLSAKAVEDTAFYRYGRLLSRNDVGFDPRRFADTTSDFHRNNLERRRQYPLAMLATATHDHKRGEDVRARLAVLSEVADEWAHTLDRLLGLGASLQTVVHGAPAPAATDLAMLFQMIVGAWPPDFAVDDAPALSSFAARIAQWQQKALREAKQRSDWASPHEPYEAAAREFVARLFAPQCGLLSEIHAFARRIARAGTLNGLSQTLLKLTAPGVPDCYQGTEYWDLSLVDPDNRRGVDFHARRASLDAQAPADLAGQWENGHVKQSLIGRVLEVRRKAPRLFSDGEYQPIAAEGPLADHVVAFARVLGDSCAITIVCRLADALLDPLGGLSIPAPAWNDTRLLMPENLNMVRFSDVLRGHAILGKGHGWHLGQILSSLPLAFLVSEAGAFP